MEIIAYLHYDGQKRTGIVTFEGRTFNIGEHPGKGLWLNVDVMREDSLDEELEIQFKVSPGMILL